MIAPIRTNPPCAGRVGGATSSRSRRDGIPSRHPNVKLRAYAAPYFALQGALTLVVWAVIVLWPPIRPHFQPPGSPEVLLMAFLLPDMLLFAGASFAAARGISRGASAEVRNSAVLVGTGSANGSTAASAGPEREVGSEGRSPATSSAGPSSRSPWLLPIGLQLPQDRTFPQSMWTKPDPE